MSIFFKDNTTTATFCYRLVLMNLACSTSQSFQAYFCIWEAVKSSGNNGKVASKKKPYLRYYEKNDRNCHESSSSLRNIGLSF